MSLTLEIVEGPGAGTVFEVDRPMVVGRSPDADIRLGDPQSSRNHARVSPVGDSALVVEDLKSVNGTFLNDNQVHDKAALQSGDELQVGVTVLRVASDRERRLHGSAVRAVPAALAVPETAPRYVNQAALDADDLPDARDEPLSPELERYRDVRVRARAQLAPLAFALLIAIVVCIYLATR